MKKLLTMMTVLSAVITTTTPVLGCGVFANYQKNLLDTFQIKANQTGAEIFTNLHTYMQVRYSLVEDKSATKIANYAIWYDEDEISNNDEIKVGVGDIITIKIFLNKFDSTIQNDQQKLINAGYNLNTEYVIDITVKEINKQDIKNVHVPDLETIAELEANYQALNQNENILNVVISTINKTLNLVVSQKDFYLTNDYEDKELLQTVGTVVTFTVHAESNSYLIQGDFIFTNTLSAKKDLSLVTIKPCQFPADVTATYDNLNQNEKIIAMIIKVVGTKFNVLVTIHDFQLTNDKPDDANQVVGTNVIMIVSAVPTSLILDNSFQFKIELK
ncbi:spiralin repeat-containing protein [Spiroplasma chrysopicola]|uniref:Lipoprotein n=1 Tax=Spiroplasma chrysopicola DF-1 TaxID=1276227 RepID=R4UGA3_9MOLU|nr:spiralin repeat-containing protein [Spiroplasma chrysopicola]AGM25130.1 hypothetical protein SCHRY_v1c05520 [Spiroplasma chrysopicola DF-1]